MITRIFHVDLDAFFASVEQALNPALKGRPVIVGGTAEQRTVVASCSYEARRRGVRTAMRTAEARRLCPEAVFLPGDYRVYRRAADLVFSRLLALTPKVQPTSLDEAYAEVQLQNSESEALERASAFCREVENDLRLPVSIGIGTSFLAARLATRVAKPRGVFLLRAGAELELLWPLSIRQLPGIGAKTAELLERFHILRVGELAALPRELLVETFGQRGALLHALAQGDDPRRVDPSKKPRSISRETSFEEPVAARGEVFAMACWLVERAMKELKEGGQSVRTLGLKVGTIDGRSEERELTLKTAVFHEANLIEPLRQLLNVLTQRRVAVQRVGVTLKGLGCAAERQRELFVDEDETRLLELEAALDRIRGKHGFGAVIRGPAIDLLTKVARDRDGYRLRIPSLTR